MKKSLPLLALLSVLSLALHAQEPVPGTWYKHLRGTINKTLGITMDLWYNGTEFRGFYCYDSKRIPIYLSGSQDGTGEIGLQESVQGETTGYFNGTFATGGMFTGTWKNKDHTKTFACVLAEDYSKGSLPLVYTGMEQVTYLLEGKTEDDAPKFEMSAYVLMPDARQGGTAAKVQPYFGDTLLHRPILETEIGKVLKDLFKGMSADYLADAEEVTEDQYGIYTWQSEEGHEVVLNDCGLLCIASSGYEYTGGAHGSYWTSYYTLDLVTGRFLAETDLFVPGYEKKLIPLLEAKYRQTYEIAPDEPLSEVLFVDQIEPNGNFYVMPNGIGWLYNIYEIQSYAQGAAELFFTWEEIAPYVKADSPLQRALKAKP